MSQVSPEAIRWLRSLKQRLLHTGQGLPRSRIPERLIEEMNKAGKIYFDAFGNVVYLVQLNERLSPDHRKWFR